MKERWLYKMTLKRKISFILLAVFTIAFLFLIYLNIHKQGRVCFNDNCFYVETAQNPVRKALGLMYRKQLGQDKGMLFIFDEEDIYPFWMKNTFIPLDIIWIDKNKEVVFIKENARPCNEKCENIYPDKKAVYVFEINGGLADKIGLSVGDKVIFDLFNP